MKFRFRSSLSLATAVDREAGILRGVQVCSMGAAKGHGVLIDRVTVESLNRLAEKSADGVRLKFNPDTFQHGPATVVGRLVKGSFAIDAAGCLRADAEIMKSYSGFNFLFDLAEKQGSTIALSVEFDGEDEEKDGIKYARPTDFQAAAIVDMGAATSGLFSAIEEEATTTTPKEEKPMKGFTDEQKQELQAMLGEAIKPLAQRMTAYEEGAQEEKEPATTGMSAADVAAERLAAGVGEGETGVTAWRKINQHRAAATKPMTRGDFFQLFRQAGGAPVGHNAGAPASDANKGKHAFTIKLEELEATGMGKAAAMRTAVKQFKELHGDYLRAQFAAHGTGKPTKTLAA